MIFTRGSLENSFAKVFMTELYNSRNLGAKSRQKQDLCHFFN